MIGLRLYIQNAYRIHEKYYALSKEKGYDWPEYSDFNFAIVIAMAYLSFEFLLYPITIFPYNPMYEIYEWLIVKKRPPPIKFDPNPTIPPLDETPSKRIGLVVEPTPFTYICGF